MNENSEMATKPDDGRWRYYGPLLALVAIAFLMVVGIAAGLMALAVQAQGVMC